MNESGEYITGSPERKSLQIGDYPFSRHVLTFRRNSGE